MIQHHRALRDSWWAQTLLLVSALAGIFVVAPRLLDGESPILGIMVLAGATVAAIASFATEAAELRSLLERDD